MEKTRLILLFQTLTNKEVKELGDFLSSPFFNKRQEVRRLFDYLVETLNIYPSTPSKEKAFIFVTGNRDLSDYDDQQVRLWMSFLFKNIEQYLVYKSFVQEKVKVQGQLAKVYRERRLPQHQERVLKKLQGLQDQRVIRNAEFFADDFQVQLERYQFISANQRIGELNLQQISDNLDTAYLAQKLKQSCLLLAHQAVYKTQYRYGLIDEVLRYVEQQNLLGLPAIAAYCYQTLTQSGADDYFPSFKKTIIEQGKRFPKDERGDLYILAINFCIKRYNAGNSAYLKDEFELYREGLEQGLFLQNQILSRFTYWNVVTLALVMKAYDWVEVFIQEYKSALDKSFRESMFSINLARLEYSRKNYKTALQLLQKSEYKDLLLNLAAKTVMLKVYFELEEFDLLDAHLGAMRTFIRRKKMIGYHQENYVNLIQFTRKLMECNPYDRKEKEQLRREIEQTKVVAEKGWLLEVGVK
ncbi:MAG: hypothetical protein AAF985_25880 [Bacteroidota bacterium]